MTFQYLISRLRFTFLFSVLIHVWSLSVVYAASEDLVKTVHPMNSLDKLELIEGGGVVVSEGPKGEKVLKFDDEFSGRIDMKDLNVDLSQYDFLKVEFKTDGHTAVVFSLENYPKEGEMSHWYSVDYRGKFDWRTVWINLKRPEEIMPSGSYKGLEREADPSSRGLLVKGEIKDMQRMTMDESQAMWLGRIRLCKKAVSVDWDQKSFSYSNEQGKDITAKYPLEIKNHLDKPLTALLKFLPYQARDSRTSFESEKIELKPGESKKVEARITLPADKLEGKPALYSEFHEVRVSAEGIEDSEVSIIRSSDPVIPLSVTIPIAEEKIKFPLLGRCKDLPSSVIGMGAVVKGGKRDGGRQSMEKPDLTNMEWDSKKYEDLVSKADVVKIEDFDVAMDGPLNLDHASMRTKGGFNAWKQSAAAKEADGRFLDGLKACAFLYDKTGDKKYLGKGTSLLVRMADVFPVRSKEWSADPCTIICHGLFAINTLRLGWVIGGFRSPYDAQKTHGFVNDFDLLAADMDPALREKIIQDFLLPSAIHMRNHMWGFGEGNAQDVVNYPILYTGLISKNWPLVADAYYGEMGVLKQLEWGFNEDGLCIEAHYQDSTIRPILWATELMYRLGVDLYDKRLHTIIHSRAAEAIGKPYRDLFIHYMDECRFKGKPGIENVKATDGFHLPLSGLTLLKWNELEVGMNWGKGMHRSAHDRCSLRIASSSRAHPLNNMGGGTYAKSSIQQSVLIIDEETQRSEKPAKIVSVDVDGAVQHVQSVSAEQYPDVTITRTFALVDKHVLAFDRVQSDKPHTVDWCLLNAGDKLTLPMEKKESSWTTKQDQKTKGIIFGEKIKEHSVYATNDSWQEGNGRMTMLGAAGTQVFSFRVPVSYAAGAAAHRKAKETGGTPMLMVRRKDAKQADFASFFSLETKSVEKVPVKKSDGQDADAVGVKVTLKDGKTFNALVNYESEGVEVVLGKLKTKDRFATDYKSE